MKKMALFAALLFSAQLAHAQNITLPQPETTGGKPLMEVIKARRTSRNFSEKALDNQTLSNILWTAWGITTEDGKRTIPTSRNQQNLQVYAILGKGTYFYNAKENILEQITAEDLRPLVALQEFALKAPLTLLFVAHDDYAAGMHAGSAYQNVGLYCASAGLGNVVRYMINHDALRQKLNIPAGDKTVISQTIGYPE